MRCKPKRVHRDVMELLEKEGVEHIELRRRKRGHPYIQGLYRGQQIKATMGGTPSDMRAQANMIAQVRRMMKVIDAGLPAAP